MVIEFHAEVQSKVPAAGTSSGDSPIITEYERALNRLRLSPLHRGQNANYKSNGTDSSTERSETNKIAK